MEKKRVQLDLHPHAIQRMDRLKTKTEATSYAEVFKNALKLYEAMINEDEAGSVFYKKDQSGNLVEFKMFF